MAWRANMDITPCTSIHVALDYIAKYCTKAEVPTASYTDIVKSVLPHVSDSRPVVSLAAKSLNKLLVERDWGSQEVVFLLLDLPLVEGSRIVLTLDCRAEQDRDAVVDVPGTDGNQQSTRPRRSLYVKYLERDGQYEATTLFTFLTRHNTKRPQPHRLPDRVPDRIICYVPRYRSDPEHPTHADYCRLKVVLHLPWRVYPSLPLTIDSTEYDTWEAAFHHLRNKDPRRLQFDYIDEIPPPEEEEEEEDKFEAPDVEEETVHAFFQELLNAGLGDAGHGNPDDLSSRPLDLSANWHASVGKHRQELPELLLPTAKDEYWNSVKASTSINLDYGTEASNAEASLNPEQRLLFETVVEHYGRAIDGLSPDPLRINVDGRAGTGKSYTIQLVSSRLETMQRSRFPTSPRRSPVARIAPTGAAANGIQGYTDHAYFGLPVQRFETLSPLGPDGVGALRRRLEGVSYLIVDEKSMISLVKLAWIDQRLRQAYPESNDDPFAGGMALFEARPVTTVAIAGKNAYKALSVTIRLVTLVRQSDTDASSIAFRRVLENMRQGNPDLTDFRTLEPRLLSRLERRERTTFEEQAVYLFATRDSVNEMNYSRLRDANVPVLLLRARHSHPRCASISSKDFNDLTAELLLSIGARVMLTTNIWAEAGLTARCVSTYVLRDPSAGDSTWLSNEISTDVSDMDSVAREVWLKAWKRDIDPSRCLLMHMPREINVLIISHLDLDVISRLGQSCRAWYQVTLPELYSRDAKEGNSFAIRWMAAYAVDEESTEIALNTLDISARFGGQVDVILGQREGQTLYETPNALHYAIVGKNLRLAKKLLDMGARHDIPCLNRRMRSLDPYSDELTDFFGEHYHIGQWFPIFLAFIHSDPDMGQLLVDRGAGRDAMIRGTPISILHLAAADQTRDIGQWRFLFDRFRKHIDERCTGNEETPLHIALRRGSIQSVQFALEVGANTEVQNAALLTPLAALVQVSKIRDQTHVACIRKIVEFGGNIHPDGDSVMVHVMEYYCNSPVMWPEIRHILNFFLDHGADLNERSLSGEIALSTVIIEEDAQPAWLFDLLSKKGAPISNDGVDVSFFHWCEGPRLYGKPPSSLFQYILSLRSEIAGCTVRSVSTKKCRTTRNPGHFELMRDGMDITIRNENGRNSLDLLLLGTCDKADCSELEVFLERELERAYHLQAQREPEGARNGSVSELAG
ncbi:uncharacterized protein CPUR_00932 [Claviceps purpurea 20.1]|uniref:ATP-dependent DNA helicase n=1 Tax=Claviceps purpurea (strain 20.1) TaxID=1111077 RepID=M1W5U5_CLAP2|nr:uncharacterized protein CPUR_00932 [Claviceps purpurea 20.1]